MGTIISALDSGNPLLLMPRLASQGEHRNDHQLSTANRFSHFSNIKIADDETELLIMINAFVNNSIESVGNIQIEVSADLIAKIKSFVNED
jgi:UDP-N-acetylglucosamine transferase subunit ALG13